MIVNTEFDVSDMIEERAAEKQFTSLGLVMHSQGGGLVICGGKDREKILTVNKVQLGDSEEWQLFSTLISRYVRFVSPCGKVGICQQKWNQIPEPWIKFQNVAQLFATYFYCFNSLHSNRSTAMQSTYSLTQCDIINIMK